MKKYEYKHLDKEMMKTLDDEIKNIGKDALYEKVEYNIRVERIQKLQNEPGAWNEIYRGGGWIYRWKFDFYFKPEIVDMKNLTMGQEMLYYIDKKRFKNHGFTEDKQDKQDD